MNRNIKPMLVFTLLALTLLGMGSGTVHKITHVKYFDGATWNQGNNMPLPLDQNADIGLVTSQGGILTATGECQEAGLSVKIHARVNAPDPSLYALGCSDCSISEIYGFCQGAPPRFTVNLPVSCTGLFNKTLDGNENNSGDSNGGLYVRDMADGSNQVIPYPGYSKFWTARCK
jgi:hypothetical protein